MAAFSQPIVGPPTPTRRVGVDDGERPLIALRVAGHGVALERARLVAAVAPPPGT